jgi:hypothetical protein
MIANAGCNALIGATDPITEQPDAGGIEGGTDATTGGMDSTPAGMDSAPEAPQSTGCSADARACSSGWSFVCADGGWTAEAACTTACDEDSGICEDCPPQRKQCTDAGAQVCGNAGTWSAPVACAYLCLGDECGGECSPATKQCVAPWTSYELCDSNGQWGSPTSCLPNEICRSGSAGCENAIHDVGWDTTFAGGAYNLGSNTLYVFRLPPLVHGAILRLFGVYGTTFGPNAVMALYDDDGSGSGPVGLPIAEVKSALGLVDGKSEQSVVPVDQPLDKTTYWLAIVLDSITAVTSAADASGKGRSYPQINFTGSFPNLSTITGYDKSGIDLGIYINVQDTD